MQAHQTILLVGATGMFGSNIARHLLDMPDARVRLLFRPSADGKKQQAMKALVDRGAELIEGDVGDPASLDRSTQGIDVIVSALQGGPDVIVDGQVALAEAGKRNGVSRILPSDYGLDLFKATPGEHTMFDMRRKADEAIAAIGIAQVNVLQGAFMELFGPGMGTIDYDKGTATFWGDGRQVIDCTSVESTAWMVARVALDRAVGSGKFAFAGDRISILDAIAVVEKQTGRKSECRSMGSESDLRAAKDAAKGDPRASVTLAYQLYMLNGQTALSDLQNDRYLDVKLETFSDFALRVLPHAASR